MRLRIRDAEWFVRGVKPVRTGGQALYVRGITCPVQGRDQIFWTEAEKNTAGETEIEIIRPENVELRLDTSSHAITTRLRIESVARHNPVSSGKIAIAHHAAMDVLNYQLQPAYHALNSQRDPRSCILIADAVGLGKTLEAGVLLSELICRGAAKRILVVTLKSMMAQFQKEMWCRFSIPLVRLDSTGLQRIRSEIRPITIPSTTTTRPLSRLIRSSRTTSSRVRWSQRPYASVIVDEAQDFSAPALRLVAAISNNTKDAPVPNSLMIVGDAHQRIYGKRAILGKCGINVMGRSSKLRLNYRTTEKIRKRAVAILKGVTVDDLDGAQDDNKSFRSLVVGKEPIEARYKTFDKEMDAIVETIVKWQKEDARTYSDYVVLARRQSDVESIAAALAERGLRSKQVKTDLTIRESEKGRVRISTMHRAKGLEFVGVVVAEVNPGIWPLHPDEYKDMDPVAQKFCDDSERSLLYVALSRAMKHAMLTGVGEISA